MIIKTYLNAVHQAMGDSANAVFYEYVLEHGKYFVAPQQLQEIDLPIPSVEKQCFYNAYNVIKYRKDFTYMEGWYTTPKLGLALDHAFNLDAQGRLVDYTAQCYVEVSEWFGVPVPRDFVMREMRRRKFSFYGDMTRLYIREQLRPHNNKISF